MNIRRQYNLPNCTLTLEGFDDGSGKHLDTLALLSNAECRFSSTQKVLSGGKVFFDHIVQATSNYAQGLLSSHPHPLSPLSTKNTVTLEALTASRHRLHWQPNPEEPASSIDLSTVELFDLTEAIDQFLADDRTLPDFPRPLSPLSRRQAKSKVSMATRMVSPLVGIGGLVLGGLALFMMPLPEAVRRSADETEQIGTPLPPEAILSDQEIDTLGNTLATVDGSQDIPLMQAYLYDTLNQAWSDRNGETDESYRLVLGTSGRLIGLQQLDADLGEENATNNASNTVEFNPETPAEGESGTDGEADTALTPPAVTEETAGDNQAASNPEGTVADTAETEPAPDSEASETGDTEPAPEPDQADAVDETEAEGVVSSHPSLNQLGYLPQAEAIASSEAIAEFRVDFEGSQLTVNPWASEAEPAPLDFEAVELEGDELDQLLQQVEGEIAAELDPEGTTFPASLSYDLGVTNEGAIALVVAEDATSQTNLPLTPLDELLEPSEAGIFPGVNILPASPLNQFQVTFQPDGTVEVSP